MRDGESVMKTLKLAAVAMLASTAFLLFVRGLWVLAEAPWNDNGLSVMLSLCVGGFVAVLWWLTDGN